MDFKEYLILNGRTENTANTYVSAVRGIEETEGKKIDLPNVDKIIKKYSAGGAKFDPEEHRNKTSALKWYKKYLDRLEYLKAMSYGVLAELTPRKYCDAAEIKDEYEYFPLYGESETFDVNELRLSLYEKINAVDGIRKLAKEMTGRDSNPEYVEIVFERRKSITTDWFDRLCNFVNYANYRAKDYFAALINMICYRIDEELKGIGRGDIDSRDCIGLLLHSVIGYFTVTSPDDDIRKKAEKLLKELKKAVITTKLYGEYVDRLLEEKYNPNKRSKIILYLDNIASVSTERDYFIDLLFSTFAHEYFHFHHYYSIWEKYDVRHGGCLDSKYEAELNAYYPGKVVKESLASYFEREYMIRNGYNAEYIDGLKKVWDIYNWRCWPYSGAKYINDVGHFSEIFEDSLMSFKRAAKALGV